MLTPDRSEPSSPTLVKGTVVRGYLQALDKLGWRNEVLARASRQTQSDVERLPLDSSWVSVTPIEELNVIVGSLHGSEGVRRVAKESVNQAVIPVLRAIIEGFLRLFGATPATLLSRMAQITASTAKGVEYQWTSTGPSSGTLLIAYTGRKNVPIEQFIGTSGTIEVVFDLCRVRGRVSEPVPSPAHPGFGATFAVRWGDAA